MLIDLISYKHVVDSTYGVVGPKWKAIVTMANSRTRKVKGYEKEFKECEAQQRRYHGNKRNYCCTGLYF